MIESKINIYDCINKVLLYMYNHLLLKILCYFVAKTFSFTLGSND